ncbi:MAG: tetratricopeptide repeat protein [Myxococcaceae bacterium]
MLNVLISAAAGVAVAILIKAMGFPLLAGIIPGTIVLLGVMVLLGRRTFTQLQAVVQAVQAELQSMNANNKKEREAKADKAIKMLEAALPLGKWQFLVEAEIHGQIGMIKHLFKDYEGALTSFKKASSRNYYAKAMQAAIYFQKKDFPAMQQAFEDAVKHGNKEGLMWAAYAWCLIQNKDNDQALRVLSRGVEQNPNDEKLKKALTALQNDKRLKMSPWEPMWWQLGLENPPMMQPQFIGGGGRRRGFR